eukprot:TRINITY_DN7060_c0_g1_i1.p1 TRINITY_DN7060_c0_g1~~TRINITY_DN7060_c0_g1_i1.p1  ORF type:complete len:729 (+),score=113.78 TRINITY_DN7060_c0_g1_i1:141-2327(+)
MRNAFCAICVIFPRLAAAHTKTSDEVNYSHSRPDLLLPDYDCQGLDIPLVEDILRFTSRLNTLAWTDASELTHDQALAEQEHWLGFVQLFATLPGWLHSDCPFGFVVAKIVLWAACVLVATPQELCEADKRMTPILLSRQLLQGPYGLRHYEALPVFMNSRWLRFFSDLVVLFRHVMPRYREQLDPDGIVAQFDCAEPPNGADEWESGWDWRDYMEKIAPHENPMAFNTFGNKGEDSAEFALNPKAFNNMPGKAAECSLGTLSMAIQQMAVSMKLLSEQVPMTSWVAHKSMEFFEQQVFSISDRRIEHFSILALSRWPVLPMLLEVAIICQARTNWEDTTGYQHKPYRLDFRPEELLSSPAERADLEKLAQAPWDDLTYVLRQQRSGRPSQAFRQVTRALERYVHDFEEWDRDVVAGRRLMIFTMLYGWRLAKYLPGWLRRIAAFGHLQRTLVFCLDDDSLQVCKESHRLLEFCIKGEEKTTSNKFHLMSTIINAGFDVLYLDFDTLLMKDPVPPIMRESGKAELLLTRDFGGECINIGVVYMKSHADTARFLQDLIRWLWVHPYEFCQKAFAGLMGLEDITWNEVFGDPVKHVPRWAFLDSANSFVTSTIYSKELQGWTGELENIIIYHFLDGAGGVEQNYAVEGRYVNLFELFYDNSKLNLDDIRLPLYEQDEEVRQQLMSTRQETAPVELRACSAIEESAEPKWKKRQRQNTLDRPDIQASRVIL